MAAHRSGHGGDIAVPPDRLAGWQKKVLPFVDRHIAKPLHCRGSGIDVVWTQRLQGNGRQGGKGDEVDHRDFAALGLWHKDVPIVFSADLYVAAPRPSATKAASWCGRS